MAIKRGPYSSPRQLERQQRILDCARQAISDVGYEALTMKDLAEASEVSIKTLYNLYGSKDELLLSAVVDLLADLPGLPNVQAASPGIARLRANLDAASAQVVATPAYAETMARALFQAGKDHRLIDILLRNTQQVILEQLQHAAEEGEIRAEVDLLAAATALAGHQWSTVLMWSKGLLKTEEFEAAARRSQLLSLIPLCCDSIRGQLESELW